MKILFFTTSNINNLLYGGGKEARSMFELLKKIGKVDLYQLLKRSNNASALSLLQGHYPPLRNDVIDDVIRKCNENNYDVVFVNTSICGNLIRCLKYHFPTLPVFTQFQNCEKDYNEVRFAGKQKIKSTIYRKMVTKSEYLTLKYSDCSATLSQRDSDRLAQIYGKGADEILPLFIKDETKRERLMDYDRTEGYCLLFGPVDNPNVEGFRWFVDNVSPYIKIKTVLAGRGFEKLKKEYASKFVEVIGYVEDIHELYNKARCVCIPLFSGGGMKVKTIEAFMFGKRVFGTKEAFSGFNIEFNNVGGLCNTQDEFINKINELVDNDYSSINLKSREIYEDFYSDIAVCEQMKNILVKLIENKNGLNKLDKERLKNA